MRIRLLLCVLAAVMLLCAAAYAADDAKKPIPVSQVLMIVGGPFHHQPEIYPILQKKLEDSGKFKLNITEDLKQLEPDNIRNYDLVLVYCTNLTLSKEQEQGLLGFVENGKGLAGIHCVTDTFKNSNAYWKLVGGKFRTHGNEMFQVNITAKSNPIAAGMSGFQIKDETYCDDFHPESKVVVFMRREKDGEPVSWIQYYGKGRVFVTALGHGKAAWENPAFQQLVLQGCEWATYRRNP